MNYETKVVDLPVGPFIIGFIVLVIKIVFYLGVIFLIYKLYSFLREIVELLRDIDSKLDE